MKKHLLIVTALWLLPFFASAQVAEAAMLLGEGISLGSKAIKNRGNKLGEFTTYFKVGQDSIPMKRTPENKLRGDAASTIRQLESYLTQVHQNFLQVEMESICPNTYAAQAYIRDIKSLQPKWDTAPYEAESAFYNKEHQRRYTAARLAEQQAREVAQRRYQARQDSIVQLARRQQAVTDSLTRIVFVRHQARQDSLDRIAETTVAVASVAKPVAVTHSVTRPTATKKPAPAPIRRVTGASVYMCNSGNTVKYHATPDCRGLNRCNASVVKISKAEAMQSMDGCKFCY
ncbi:hypothetical protein [Hymenobacter sp. YC55]|uniref:hypothetical protein n=1 Tax=Hymenobacter sp. YC55 TaxID=3034019 RepID=UPI0023F9A697|nr:hypothetical protein [Hymenobacter sp. YC55]MDF7813639.1 hypothetical protein [Hymenobacter sp. YC55]